MTGVGRRVPTDQRSIRCGSRNLGHRQRCRLRPSPGRSQARRRRVAPCRLPVTSRETGYRRIAGTALMARVLWIVPAYPWGADLVGLFYRTQAEALARTGLGIVVAAPTPWAPWPLSHLRERWHRYATAPTNVADNGVTVIRPRYLNLPGEPRWAFPDRMIARSVFRKRRLWSGTEADPRPLGRHGLGSLAPVAPYRPAVRHHLSRQRHQQLAGPAPCLDIRPASSGPGRPIDHRGECRPCSARQDDHRRRCRAPPTRLRSPFARGARAPTRQGQSRAPPRNRSDRGPLRWGPPRCQGRSRARRCDRRERRPVPRRLRRRRP